jgi:hypothetical protein
LACFNPEQTEKAVHIIINISAKDGSTQIILERKIPLVTIKSIAMSNLRDDWLVSSAVMSYRLVLTHQLGSEYQ